MCLQLQCADKHMKQGNTAQLGGRTQQQQEKIAMQAWRAFQQTTSAERYAKNEDALEKKADKELVG